MFTLYYTVTEYFNGSHTVNHSTKMENYQTLQEAKNRRYELLKQPNVLYGVDIVSEKICLFT